jgi:hypothetical protein
MAGLNSVLLSQDGSARLLAPAELAVHTFRSARALVQPGNLNTAELG